MPTIPRSPRLRWMVLLAAALAPAIPLACTSNNPPPPPETDAGGFDSSVPDTSQADTSQPDSSQADSSPPDASQHDASVDAPNDTASEADAGPPVLEIIGSGFTNPDQIVTDTTFLYVTETLNTDSGSQTAIVRCPVAGCGASGPTVVASNLSFPGGLAISGTTLFWSDSFTVIKSCDVSTVPCTGTIFETGVDDAGGNPYPTQLWVNAGNLYWFQQNGNDRLILTCPVTGCVGGNPVTVLYASTGSPLAGASTSGLATDGTYIYAALFTGGPLLRYTMTSAQAADPTSETNVGTTPSATHVLDLDGTTLRWAESGNGEIGACTAPGCATVTAALTGLNMPYAVTHDATYIYGADWGNTPDAGTTEDGGTEDSGTTGNGVLWRIAKQ
ncbi:MAG: hypothetical protein ACLQBL_12905 [Polyangiaceae bacterium]